MGVKSWRTFRKNGDSVHHSCPGCQRIGKIKFDVTVQDGGKTGAKAGVKLAYKHVFAPVFTPEEPPMLLVRLRPGNKMRRPE